MTATDSPQSIELEERMEEIFQKKGKERLELIKQSLEEYSQREENGEIVSTDDNEHPLFQKLKSGNRKFAILVLANDEKLIAKNNPGGFDFGGAKTEGIPESVEGLRKKYFINDGNVDKGEMNLGADVWFLEEKPRVKLVYYRKKKQNKKKRTAPASLEREPERAQVSGLNSEEYDSIVASSKEKEGAYTGMELPMRCSTMHVEQGATFDSNVYCAGTGYFENGIITKSDERAKENIVPVDKDDALKKSRQIDPITYNMKGDDKPQMSVRAQSVFDLGKETMEDGSLAVNHGALIANNIASQQRLDEKVKDNTESVLNIESTMEESPSPDIEQWMLHCKKEDCKNKMCSGENVYRLEINPQQVRVCCKEMNSDSFGWNVIKPPTSEEKKRNPHVTGKIAICRKCSTKVGVITGPSLGSEKLSFLNDAVMWINPDGEELKIPFKYNNPSFHFLARRLQKNITVCPPNLMILL
eukprot:TRINITY_DN5003_c0_g1_i1.p1 TRINITY_DN5003_c0_g1~~TRINITY_DN5003_c0_g1_i1.p1  ORF type:complete len:482 (-),score=126.75 TRINITY_DN5003_c0_g1_i1:2389-3801(-)